MHYGQTKPSIAVANLQQVATLAGPAEYRLPDLAEILRAWQLLGVALFPCCQQVGQHLAVGLHGQLFERHVGGFKSLTLGAEGGIAEARAALFKCRACVAVRTIAAWATLLTVRFKLVVCALARAAGFAAGAA